MFVQDDNDAMHSQLTCVCVCVCRVSHAKTCIAKPLSKSQEASRREVEEAMKKVKEAQSLISAAAGGQSGHRPPLGWIAVGVFFFSFFVPQMELCGSLFC